MNDDVNLCSCNEWIPFAMGHVMDCSLYFPWWCNLYTALNCFWLIVTHQYLKSTTVYFFQLPTAKNRMVNKKKLLEQISYAHFNDCCSANIDMLI